jgi:hypothetical protein
MLALRDIIAAIFLNCFVQLADTFNELQF